MLGLITMPILGWNLGTWLGGAISAVLPQALPECDGNCPVRDVYCTDSAGGTQIAVGVLRHHSGSCDGVHFKNMFRFLPVFSSGFRVILVTIAASVFGAWKFPHDPDR